MGRMGNMMMLIVVVEMALLLFTGTTDTPTSAMEAMYAPQEWTQSPLFSTLFVIFTALGVAGIIVGTYFVRNEWVAYLGISLVFLSFGATLYKFHAYMSSTGAWGGSDTLIVTILGAPMIILYIITILDFSRGKD